MCCGVPGGNAQHRRRALLVYAVIRRKPTCDALRRVSCPHRIYAWTGSFASSLCSLSPSPRTRHRLPRRLIVKHCMLSPSDSIHRRLCAIYMRSGRRRQTLYISLYLTPLDFEISEPGDARVEGSLWTCLSCILHRLLGLPAPRLLAPTPVLSSPPS